MPVTITLSTVPGKLTRERGYTTKTIELFGPSLATETVSAIGNVAQIKQAVARFGAKVRADHPNESFYVSVHLQKGARKPNGYDAATPHALFSGTKSFWGVAAAAAAAAGADEGRVHLDCFA